MKTFRLITLFTSVFLYLSAYSQEDVVVATDRYLEEADMDGYNTFTFADHISEADNNDFFWDSELMKLAIKEEIIDEMTVLGYEYIESADADLMVNFRIMEDPTEYTGWIDNYADDKYWGKFSLSARKREPDDKKTYYLDKGTLLVQFVDLNDDAVVWSGYASGIADDDEFLDGEEEKVDMAVEKIFDEYNFKAADY